MRNCTMTAAVMAAILSFTLPTTIATAAPSNSAGAVSIQFITKATGMMPAEFAIPALLYFDTHGCLKWSNYGLGDSWEQTLPSVESDAKPCDAPTLPAVLDQLRSEGIVLDPSKQDASPLLLWYGSDAMCPDCAEKSAQVLPKLLDRLPPKTRLIRFDWK